MARRKRKSNIPPQPGWAIYLRTSSEEAQNPENSQRRQRHTIKQSLLERENLPVYQEYVDNLSGRYANNRPGYQQMLDDARAGCFSHVAVENAERFGRNDTEALVAIDELHELGVSVRFADYPDLDPIDADDRLMITISFTLARRESIKLGQRVSGGMHAKLRNGGSIGRAPDGYINCEERVQGGSKRGNGKYNRWVETDPEQFKVWRLAWDLLLTNQYSLPRICEDLHERGYKFRSGRTFVKIREDGKRRTSANGLSRIFKNWFYAGWVVSEKAGIPPKTVRGNWKPLVTTEEFEEGLAILASRQKSRGGGGRVHNYLLTGLVYVSLANGKYIRLIGSTPNSSRSGGGTSYYCVESSPINIMCQIVDNQIPNELMKIQVDPEKLPLIRQSYNDEIAQKLGVLRPNQRAEIEQKLKDIDGEEARALRLYTMGRITEHIWNNMWSEWQDRRHSLRRALESLQARNEVHVSNLDDALTIIAKVSILYSKLARDNQKKLLREMVDRIIVDPEGRILRMELLPPFAYLNDVKVRVEQGGEDFEEKQKATVCGGKCSSENSSSDPQVSRSDRSPQMPQVKNFAQYVEITAYPQRSALEPLLTERQI